MSSALASAKRKRAVPESVTPQNVPNKGGANLPGAPASSPPSGPLTIPQAFAMVERRLKTLESFMEKSNGQTNVLENKSDINTVFEQQSPNIPENLVDILDEYNARFDILAEEISNLKNIVLSLQSYTMEVNKTLMEERIRVLSNTYENAVNNNIDELISDAKEITLEEALSSENL